MTIQELRFEELAEAEEANTTPEEQGSQSLRGLVLSGGKSVRMGMDKGSIAYHGKSQRQHVYEMLQSVCADVFVSCNSTQFEAARKENLPVLEDKFEGLGPIGGMLTAFEFDPFSAWFVIACDLPFLRAETLEYLSLHRNKEKAATAFYDPEGRFPEPLITIWEPRSYPVLKQALEAGLRCPRKVLINSDAELLTAPDTKELQNINHRSEYDTVLEELKTKELRSTK